MENSLKDLMARLTNQAVDNIRPACKKCGYLTKMLCIVLGLVSLMHAAYSAAQHRSYLHLIEQEFHYLPLDIVCQAVLSLLVIIWGVTAIGGDFKEIRATTELENKSFENIRPSFYTFSHRGRVLCSAYSQGHL